jgi:hypothetical protein
MLYTGDFHFVDVQEIGCAKVCRLVGFRDFKTNRFRVRIRLSAVVHSDNEAVGRGEFSRDRLAQVGSERRDPALSGHMIAENSNPMNFGSMSLNCACVVYANLQSKAVTPAIAARSARIRKRRANLSRSSASFFLIHACQISSSTSVLSFSMLIICLTFVLNHSGILPFRLRRNTLPMTVNYTPGERSTASLSLLEERAQYYQRCLSERF